MKTLILLNNYQECSIAIFNSYCNVCVAITSQLLVEDNIILYRLHTANNLVRSYWWSRKLVIMLSVLWLPFTNYQSQLIRHFKCPIQAVLKHYMYLCLYYTSIFVSEAI